MKLPLELTIVVQYYYPDFGAEGQLLTDLGTGLRKLGCDVSVLTAQPSYVWRERAPRHETHEGVEIRRVFNTRFDRRGKIGRALNYLTLILALLVATLTDRRSGPLLIVSGPPFLGLVGYAASRLRGRDFILLVLDVFPEAAIRLGWLSPDGLGRKVWDFLDRLVLRRAARIVALSDAMKDILQNKVKAGTPAESQEVVVIHNWADPELIRPRPKTQNDFAKAQGLEDVFVVLYSGNMGLSHDLETVIEAAALLQDRELLFLLIGAGAKKEKLEAMAKRENLRNVRFMPFQPREVFPLSATCGDVTIVSQERGIEGLAMPSKIYTCLAGGRPIVALVEMNSEVSRIIREGRCGRTVLPKNAQGLAEVLEYYRTNPEAAMEDGRNARAHFERHFTLSRACQEYYSLIASLRGDDVAVSGRRASSEVSDLAEHSLP